MKKRWFVAILTIGLLLCVMPLSALALSSDPITDSDGTIIGWEDLSTDLCSFDVSDVSDVSQEQTPVAVDPGTNAASGPAETDPVETDPVKDAADANSAKTAAAATTPFVEDLYADDPIPDLYADTPGSADGTGSDQAVCAINGKTYATLTEAIDDAADGAQIDLLQDIELSTGLEFHSKNLTISGGNTYTLTLEQYGMYAYQSDITFQDLTLTIHAAQHTHEHSAGNTANLITHSSKLHLSHVEFSLTPDQILGSGIFLEHDSDLYFEDNTNAEISGFAAEEASGIYAESYSEDGHGIWVTSSSLKVTDCGWYGMTIDPINLTLDNADVYFTGNGLYGYGGALGCYGVGSYGGGLRNYSTATLSDDVQLYNNHAKVGGDDIENGDGATITFGATGSDWALDGYPDCYHPIDGWYDDYESTRWNAHAEDEADLHMVLVEPVTSYTNRLSLKAAHGPTGSLIVHKQTTGEMLVDDCDAEFTFVLTLDDETIDTVNDERYGVRFENGKATFTLKDGESKTIENLPVRMGYTITEQSKGGWLLARVDGDAEGKVPYRATAEIAFVNEKQTATGSLVVTKELAGELDADDADTVFNFMLMLDDNTITTADAEEYGVQFENGIASFSLKGGESITIANLPAGVGYTIAEVRQTGWTLQSVSGADTGVVPKNDTAEIVFTNLKNGTDIPDVPVVPTEPEEPTEPESPETPETPEEPAEPDAPAQDETPGEEPAQDDTTVPAQPAETPALDTTKADTLPQTGTTGWLAVVLMSFGFGLLACGWFFTRKQRAAKH